ncbi:MAG TPA: nickel-type superoxide dismutase maturation protease, partial [Egibacteraceae bacterium]
MSARRRVAAAALAAAAAAVALGSFERVEVAGPSMLPTLAPGDRLLVRRHRLGARRPQPGALVVVRDPRAPQRRTVKRLVAVTEAGAVVLGDNPAASTDSRHWGPVPWSLVTGTVVYRYA